MISVHLHLTTQWTLKQSTVLCATSTGGDVTITVLQIILPNAMLHIKILLSKLQLTVPLIRLLDSPSNVLILWNNSASPKVIFTTTTFIDTSESSYYPLWKVKLNDSIESPFLGKPINLFHLLSSKWKYGSIFIG